MRKKKNMNFIETNRELRRRIWSWSLTHGKFISIFNIFLSSIEEVQREMFSFILSKILLFSAQNPQRISNFMFVCAATAATIHGTFRMLIWLQLWLKYSENPSSSTHTLHAPRLITSFQLLSTTDFCWSYFSYSVAS